MPSKLTIVMYHYVRDLESSRYPDIKGLDVRAFREQVEYLARHYRVVSMESVLDALAGDPDALPSRAALLTFDDGYLDHYTTVLPILSEYGMQGSFFVPVRAIAERRVLPVNKIHFVLASESDKRRIVRSIMDELGRLRADHELESDEAYWKRLATPTRFDDAEVVFVKRMLQVELEEGLRNRIVDRLFAEYVGIDEKAFAGELYLTRDQIAQLARSGMHVGCHGYEHYWLSRIPRAQQEAEIDLALDFLATCGLDRARWTMCYPYGDHDRGLVGVIRDRGCRLGLTTRVDVADCRRDDPFELPRLDTNDLPKAADAAPNEWFERAA